MQTILGWILLVFAGAMLLIQFISVVSFTTAQRLGLQETPDSADTLLIRAERYVAWWDLVTLVWLPLGGLLMILDHALWPVVSLVGGAIYIDTAGREAAKNLSFRHEGLRVGGRAQQRLFFASYVVMLLLGIIVVAWSLPPLLMLLDS